MAPHASLAPFVSLFSALQTDTPYSIKYLPLV